MCHFLHVSLFRYTYAESIQYIAEFAACALQMATGTRARSHSLDVTGVHGGPRAA